MVAFNLTITDHLRVFWSVPLHILAEKETKIESNRVSLDNKGDNKTLCYTVTHSPGQGS